MPQPHFADDIVSRISQTSPVLLGLDPNFSLMPAQFQPQSATPAEIQAALTHFCITVIDATKHLVPAIKPQIAYFEQCGLAGMHALADVLEYAKKCNLLIVMDAKRGDIGSTSQAYSTAYLADNISVLPHLDALKNPFSSDAVTVNPFLGDDALQPFISDAKNVGKGLFVLVKTSNPGSAFLQDKLVQPSNSAQNNQANHLETISNNIADWVEAENTDCIGQSGFGLIGAVVGATWPQQALQLRKRMPHTLFLVPGIGAQGGSFETVKACLNHQKQGVLLPISRGILYPTIEQGANYSDAVRKATEGFVKEAREIL